MEFTTKEKIEMILIMFLGFPLIVFFVYLFIGFISWLNSDPLNIIS